jgi:hypothetical protein
MPISLEEFKRVTGWSRFPIAGELVIQNRAQPHTRDDTWRIENDFTIEQLEHSVYEGDDRNRYDPLYDGKDIVWNGHHLSWFRPVNNITGICNECRSRCKKDGLKSCPLKEE